MNPIAYIPIVCWTLSFILMVILAVKFYDENKVQDLEWKLYYKNRAKNRKDKQIFRLRTQLHVQRETFHTEWHKVRKYFREANRGLKEASRSGVLATKTPLSG